MLKKTITALSVLIGGMAIGISGCYKTTTVVVNPGSDIKTEVSFSKDVNPLFTNSCALSGCHVPGGKIPDLSAADAYGSLMSGGYVKPFDPDNSVLMSWLTGKKTPVMPLGSGPDENINAEVYAWINQGAKNN